MKKNKVITLNIQKKGIHKRIIFTFFMVATILINLVGCATIVRSGNARIELTSEPQDAKVMVYDMKDRLVFEGQTPVVFRPIRSASKEYKIVYEKDDFSRQTQIIKSRMSWWTLGDLYFLLLGSLGSIEVIADAEEDGNYDLLGVTIPALTIPVYDLLNPGARVYPKQVSANLYGSSGWSGNISNNSEYNTLGSTHLPLNSTDYDRLVLYDGSIISAIVVEMSSREIRYRLANNPGGPIRLISTSEVMQIIHRNGYSEDLKRYRTPIDPEKTSLMISLDPSGFVFYGPGLSFAYISGNFYNQYNLRFPSEGKMNEKMEGIALGSSFNYFLHNKIGGFYLGGMFEYASLHPFDKNRYDQGMVALNVGFDFFMQAGLFFKTECNLGVLFDDYSTDFTWRPNVSIGYRF